MREILSDIKINASPQRVWEVLTDLASYSLWNPFVRNALGRVQEGEQLQVFIKPPDSRGMTFKPVVKEVVPQRRFSWLGHLMVPGLFDGEHIFEIDPISEEEVRFIQRERFRGIFVPLLLKGIGTKTEKGFEAMNQALKSRAENK
ncbi:SRPBCC domain-containing protein [candidate division KSB1 bacterium]|nr:SRPBCC domain-containing protein [candidate division KSB1 bacterium]